MSQEDLQNRALPPAREFAWLAAGLALALFVHSLTVFHGVCENDQARMLSYGAYWHYTGTVAATYFRVSPLFIHMIKLLMDWGRSLATIPAILNTQSVVLGVGTLAGLHLLWRRLLNPRAALAGCVMAFFCPAFFISTNYGMPHVPAFFFFVFAVFFFDLALEQSGRAYAAWMIAAYSCFMMTCGMKADQILLGGAFFGLILVRRAFSVRDILLSLLIAPAGLLFVTSYTKYFAPDLGSIQTASAEWSKAFPMTIKGIMNREQFETVVLPTGPVILAAGILASAFLALKGRRGWGLLAFASAWCLPALLWWGLRGGNSARHMMAPVLAIPFLAGGALYWIDAPKRRALAALVAIIAANYFSYGPRETTAIPSTRLLGTSLMIQDHLKWVAMGSQKFAYDDVPKKAIIGGWGIDYSTVAAVGIASSVEYKDNLNFVLTMPWGFKNIRQQVVCRTAHSLAEAQKIADELRAQGYDVFSMEYLLKP